MARPIKLSTITKLFSVANRLEARSDKRRKEAKKLKEKYVERQRRK